MSNPESNLSNESKTHKNKSPESKSKKPKDTYQQLMEEGKQVLDNIHFNSYHQPIFVLQKETEPLPSITTQNIKPPLRTQRPPQSNEDNGREHPLEEDSRREPNQNTQQIAKKSSKLFGCNCLKSKCTKNYCECFTQARKCNELCKCTGCQNQGEIQKRYRPIIQAQDGQKFCNCKKSNCLKKYCECYNSEQKCNSNCKCQECKNKDDVMIIETHEVKEEMKRQKSQKQIGEINAKIDQVSKMVPKQHQQYLLSFLNYWLS